MNIDGIEIKWLGHSGFLIKNSRVIYIDPFNIKEPAENEKADLILLTHSHYDHCSVADMNKIIKEGTRIIAPADCQSKLTKFKMPVRIQVAEPMQELNFAEMKIATFPAYNTDKSFHAKEELWMGYLVKMNGVLIYHAGDTDLIPEMQKLTGYNQQEKKFIALLPIGGRFTMNVEEAVEAAKILKPYLVIPMHYDAIVGDENDAREFCELCKEENIHCEILEKE